MRRNRSRYHRGCNPKAPVTTSDILLDSECVSEMVGPPNPSNSSSEEEKENESEEEKENESVNTDRNVQLFRPPSVCFSIPRVPLRTLRSSNHQPTSSSMLSTMSSITESSSTVTKSINGISISSSSISAVDTSSSRETRSKSKSSCVIHKDGVRLTRSKSIHTTATTASVNAKKRVDRVVLLHQVMWRQVLMLMIVLNVVVVLRYPIKINSNFFAFLNMSNTTILF